VHTQLASCRTLEEGLRRFRWIGACRDSLLLDGSVLPACVIERRRSREDLRAHPGGNGHCHHDVRRDTIQIMGSDLRQGHYCMLRGRVRRSERHRRERRGGGDVDHVSHPGLRHHAREECVESVEDAVQVDVDHASPRVDGHVPHLPVHGDAGVVDQKVDATPARPHRLSESLQVCGSRHVHWHRNCVDTLRCQISRVLFGSRPVDVGQSDSHATSGCSFHKSSPQAGGGTGDDRHAPRERIAGHAAAAVRTAA